MDASLFGAGLSVRHRHEDGSWAALEPREHHSPADHDPERDWGEGRLYECTTCDEQVVIEGAGDAKKDDS
jgi:hypothetical protein